MTLLYRPSLSTPSCSEATEAPGRGGGDSLTKVGTVVRARALGILGINLCPGIRFREVNFARALGFWQFLTKNV